MTAENPDLIHRKHSEAIRALNKLLQKAIDNAIIRDDHRGHQIAVGEYRSLLNSHRRSHNVGNRLFIYGFRPVIQNDVAREGLLNVIRDAMKKYVQDGKLQSAQIVTSGALAGFHINDLLSHLLTIAIARGTAFAANSFYECVDKASVDLQFVTMIEGVKIENPIEVSEGIRLIPVPYDANDFPPYIHIDYFGSYADYFGRTLIVVDEVVSPVFARPDEMSPTNHPSPFKRLNVNIDYPDFLEREFCEAISLSADHSVNLVSWWSYIDPDEVYAVNYLGGVSGYAHGAGNRFGTHSIEVNEQDIRKAMSLYVARKNLNADVARKLRVPIDRWLRAKTDKDPVDTFINLGTALESLYLEDSNRSELGFKLALRAAWHLGNSVEERTSLKEDFTEIYRLRSDAVHTGDVKKARATPEFTARAQKLCLKSIIQIIQDGGFPDWDRLIMGSG